MLLALLLAAVDLTAFAARTQPSIVLVQQLDSLGEPRSSGTGFVISADGRIATNHHVIANADRLRATFSDGKKLEVVGIVADDPDHDLAILKIDGSGYPALQLGAALGLQPGVPIAVVGHPLGMSASIADGTIAAVRSEVPKPIRRLIKGEVIQINAFVTHGNSGSPVQTLDGLVVGIQFAGLDRLSFAIPVERLRELIARVPAGAKLTAIGTSTKTNWLISAGLAAAALIGFALVRAAQSQRAARRLAQGVIVNIRR
jgi:S1-C subfamily serine protease